MRLALKIAYDGTAFHGEARQPGLRTVEGEVIHALCRARAIQDVRSSKFQSASRTDRGVSALGNVVAFASSLAPHACVRAFNAKAPSVWAWAAAAVPDDFSARRARARWYRYVLSDDHDPGTLAAALGVFVGDHDFRNFTRDHARTVVRIDEATARREGDTVVLDFRAPRFRWNLVRRLVAAAMIVEAGRITVGDVEHALRSRTRVDYGLAPPEPLTLMDVVYDDLVFEAVTDHTTLTRVRRLLGNQRRSMALLAQIETRFREGQRSTIP